MLLTKIHPQADQNSKSAPLEIPLKEQCRLVIVKGVFSGNALCSAEIVEVLPHLTGALFISLIEKGIISLEELKKYLKDIEEKEKRRPLKKKLCALVIGNKKVLLVMHLMEKRLALKCFIITSLKKGKRWQKSY